MAEDGVVFGFHGQERYRRLIVSHFLDIFHQQTKSESIKISLNRNHPHDRDHDDLTVTMTDRK